MKAFKSGHQFTIFERELSSLFGDRAFNFSLSEDSKLDKMRNEKIWYFELDTVTYPLMAEENPNFKEQISKFVLKDSKGVKVTAKTEWLPVSGEEWTSYLWIFDPKYKKSDLDEVFDTFIGYKNWNK
jgi:hypothetical protein